MTYLNVDKRRFEYLLSLGTDEFELRRFFSESRIALIQNRGRVQNLPAGQKARTRALAYELPAATDSVLHNWFSRNLKMVDPVGVNQLIDEFKLYEELKEEIPEDTAKRLARSCLVHLFSTDASTPLLDFLRSPIGGNPPPVSQSIDGEASIQPSTALSDASEVIVAHTQLPDALLKLLVDLVNAQDVDEDLAQFPPTFGMFVSGLQAAQLGRRSEARSIAAALPSESVARKLLEEFSRAKENLPLQIGGSVRGLITQNEAIFSGEFYQERDEVLGYCTNSDRSTAVFIKPLAIVRSAQALFLNGEDPKRLFPDTGSVIAFNGPNYPRQPTRGEVGVWQVAEHETEKRTRFHLASDKRAVFEARMVPFPSTDPDSVRDYLKQSSLHSHRSSSQPLIYQLADGLVLACRPDRAELHRDETYEAGLLAWQTMPAIRFDGRLYVIGPLPKEQLIYECGSLFSTAKSVFRSVPPGNGSASSISRAQLRDLGRLLEAEEFALTGPRIARLGAALDRLVENEEALEILVKEVARQPEIKNKVDALVALEASKKLEEKSELSTEIDRLRKERTDWEDRVRREREEHKRLRDETTKTVRSAFEKARNEGIPKLLADAAIWGSLIPATTSAGVPAHPDSVRGTFSATTPYQRRFDEAPEDSVAALRKFGVPKQCATAFEILRRVAHGAGLLFGVKGASARSAVQTWAIGLGKRGVLLDVTVGLIDDFAVRSAMDAEPVEVLVLLDANFSALDIYARTLADTTLTHLVRPSSQVPPNVFLVLSDGLASLPIPKSFQQIMLEVDLEGRYAFADASQFDQISAGDLIANSPMLSRLWSFGAHKVLEQIESLPAEERTLALSVLQDSSAHSR